MTAPLSSRQAVLDRIRAATPDADTAPYSALPRNYIHIGSLDPAACLQLMAERLREYGAAVSQCTPAQLPLLIAALLKESYRRVFIAPPALPSQWLAGGFKWKIDRVLSHEEMELCDGVLTAAFAGIADSGTIVLHHSPTEGRRVITLLPDWHLCVLFASQIVETLPEYFARCPNPPPLATYISGPSATADIEMTRIQGVHGPRHLNVILVHDEE
jgi:L-lactate dehydrogenase complex protein LldG